MTTSVSQRLTTLCIIFKIIALEVKTRVMCQKKHGFHLKNNNNSIEKWYLAMSFTSTVSSVMSLQLMIQHVQTNIIWSNCNTWNGPLFVSSFFLKKNDTIGPSNICGSKYHFSIELLLFFKWKPCFFWHMTLVFNSIFCQNRTF
jgi:hypothetical protein